MKKSILLIVLGIILTCILWVICYADSCPGDINCDGVVDGSDLAEVAKDYGNPSCPNCIVAPVPKTGLKTSTYPGDDGDLLKGVAWPEPRFTDNENGTITDHLTGLIWLKEANCLYQDTWHDAVDVCNSLANGQCGLSDGSVPGDWRLPNVRELFSIIDLSKYSPHFFDDLVRLDNYWSSTLWAGESQYQVLAWRVHINSGETLPINIGSYHYIWPVRGGSD